MTERGAWLRRVVVSVALALATTGLGATAAAAATPPASVLTSTDVSVQVGACPIGDGPYSGWRIRMSFVGSNVVDNCRRCVQEAQEVKSRERRNAFCRESTIVRNVVVLWVKNS